MLNKALKNRKKEVKVEAYDKFLSSFNLLSLNKKFVSNEFPSPKWIVKEVENIRKTKTDPKAPLVKHIYVHVLNLK